MRGTCQNQILSWIVLQAQPHTYIQNLSSVLKILVIFNSFISIVPPCPFWKKKLPKQCHQLEDKQEKRAYDIIQRYPPKLTNTIKILQSVVSCHYALIFCCWPLQLVLSGYESNINMRMLFFQRKHGPCPKRLSGKLIVNECSPFK